MDKKVNLWVRFDCKFSQIETQYLQAYYKSILVYAAFCVILSGFVERMPVSYYIIGIMCQLSLTLGIRFSYRFILLLRGRKNKNAHEKKVMLIGAGAAGQMIFRDIKGAKETNERVVCLWLLSIIK